MKNKIINITLNTLLAFIVFADINKINAQMIASNYRRYEEIKTQAGKPFIIERTDGINLRFIPLVNKLVALGWDESWVREKFADNSTVFIPKLALTSFNKSKVLKE